MPPLKVVDGRPEKKDNNNCQWTNRCDQKDFRGRFFKISNKPDEQPSAAQAPLAAFQVPEMQN